MPRETRALARSVGLTAVALALLAGAAAAAGPKARRHLLPTRQWDNAWSRGAVFYEVFVRSFADSDGNGNGDLPGLIAKLDYLNDGNPDSTTDLGVDAIWLMPVFASPSYHGYDVTDYETINPDYGTNEDFTRLCQEAHQRGIRVIIDFVMNHTSSQHPWFEEAASSLTSSWRNWYLWSPVDPGWRQPWDLFTGAETWHRNSIDGWWYYGMFSEVMPDLNYTNPDVPAEMQRLAKLWLDRGADGFRLDAARYIIEDGGGFGQQDTPETHAFWKRFAAYVREVKPQATMVGEVWADTPTIATYYGSTASVTGGDELPMSFDFPVAAAIIAGVGAGNAGGIASALSQVQGAYPAGVTDAPFLTNHDQIRIATQLGNNAGQLRNAAAILLTLPGSPFIYYGEEVGMQNGGTGSDDVLKRTPMPWDGSSGGGFTSGTPWTPFAPGHGSANVASETADPDSLLARYRALIRVRHSSVALQQGDLEILASGNSRVLAFLRRAPDDSALVVHNLGDSFVTVGPFAMTGTAPAPLFIDSGGSLSPGAGGGTVTLPPRASGVWRLN